MGLQEDYCRLLFTSIKKAEDPERKTWYWIGTCPNPECKNKKRDNEVKCPSGWSNGYNHLLSCIAKGDKEAFNVLCKTQEAEKLRERRIRPFFRGHGNLSPQDGAQQEENSGSTKSLRAISKDDKILYQWIELIVLKNLHLSAVDDKIWRKHIKGSGEGGCNFSHHFVRDVILMLSYLVEQLVEAEM